MAELSSLLLIYEPLQKEAIVKKINQINEAEIFHEDDTRHQMIVVLEVKNAQTQIDIFKKLRLLDGVIDLSLINHWFEENTDLESPSVH